MVAHVLSMLALAFAVSLDGFGVGVTYGLRKIRIPFLSVSIIACCSGIIIWLSMQAGGWIGGFVSEAASKLIGAGILIAIGCWALIQLKIGKRSKEADEPNDNTEVLEQAAAGPMTILKLELKRLGLVIQILRKPQTADVDRSGIISASEAVMLGVALSLDAFGAGIGAALLDLPAIPTALVIAVSSAVFLVSGTRIGMRFSSNRRMHALTVLPGILLIMLGVMKLL